MVDFIPPIPFSTIAGVPVANIFPLQPLALGQPNTLVCMVENIFPPAVEISWQLNEVPVTEGVTQTHYTPTADLAFVRFSYLLTEPAEGDHYACIITHEGDNSSVITYWGERGDGDGDMEGTPGLVVIPSPWCPLPSASNPHPL